MKLGTKLTPIAIAMAALSVGPAMANDQLDLSLLVDAKVNARADLGLSVSKYKNDTEVKVERKTDTDRYIDVDGDIEVDGDIDVESSSSGMTSQNQNNYLNTNIMDDDYNGNNGESLRRHNDDGDFLGDYLVDNNARANGNALQDASGNIGLNMASGTNNAQDNSAALSRVDADMVFAAADSISNQNAERNTYAYLGNQFNANLGGNTLRDASGNIAVNIAAGNSNLQANSLAASVNSNGNLAEATVSSQQTLDHNVTSSQGMLVKVKDTVDVTLNGSVSGTLPDVAYDGQSDQIGDVYPDMWTGDTHASGTQTGHFDLDTDTQGGSDLNGDGGALAFNEDGTILFSEAGEVTLDGTFTGNVVTTQWIVRPHQNNATINGNALRGASGNIGVNIAAGTNNLQGNHLSIAAANGGGNGGE